MMIAAIATVMARNIMASIVPLRKESKDIKRITPKTDRKYKVDPITMMSISLIMNEPPVGL
jgi:hypothetical protein